MSYRVVAESLAFTHLMQGELNAPLQYVTTQSVGRHCNMSSGVGVQNDTGSRLFPKNPELSEHGLGGERGYTLGQGAIASHHQWTALPTELRV